MMTGDEYRVSIENGRAVYADVAGDDDIASSLQFDAVLTEIAKGHDRYFVPSGQVGRTRHAAILPQVTNRRALLTPRSLGGHRRAQPPVRSARERLGQ